MTEKKANYTSGQIEFVMDSLLYASLVEVIKATKVFDSQLAYLLSLLTSNKKRKPYNAESRERAMSLLVKAMSVEGLDKMEYIKEFKMERNFIFVFLENFLNNYYDLYTGHYRSFIMATNKTERIKYARKLDAIAQDLGATSRSSLFRCLVNLNDMLPQFMEYFNGVVADYYRLCTQQARFYIDTNRGKNYDPHDVNQNFLRNVLVAINKFDSHKGAMVPYVKWWIINAQTSGSREHEYGIAYTVPQTQRKKIALGKDATINFSVSLDAPASDNSEGSEELHALVSDDQRLEDIVDAQRAAHKLAALIKTVDPYGIARLSLDISEHFTQKELDQMHMHMQQSKTVNRSDT